MRRLLLATLISLGGLVATTEQAQAQVNVNINIGQQPLWGPVGYDYAQFYYIPQMNVYYDVLNSLFYYQQGRRWMNARMLPPRFGHFDLYRMHKIVMNQHNPFRYNNRHMQQYGNYRSMQHQMAIRDARENRYYAHPQHPRHNMYRNDHGPRHQAPVAQHRGPQRMEPHRGQQHDRNNRMQAQRSQQVNRMESQRAPQQQRRQFAERPQHQQQRVQSQRAPQQHRATPQRGHQNNGPRQHEGGRR